MCDLALHYLKPDIQNPEAVYTSRNFTLLEGFTLCFEAMDEALLFNQTKWVLQEEL